MDINVNKQIPILELILENNNNLSASCDRLNKIVCYREYKYRFIFYKTHSLKDSKGNIRKLTILPLSPHTSLIFETTKPKIVKKKKKIGNIGTSQKIWKTE